jgi:protein-S-isoprenylcysteine O-methyltransferase Ste14
MTENSITTSLDNPGVAVRPPLLYGAAFIAVLVFRWFWPMPIFGHAVALSLVLASVLLGVGIAAWGRRTLQAAGTNVNLVLPTTTIVTSGPFRFTRNPLYVGLTLVYCGLTLAFNTW